MHPWIAGRIVGTMHEEARRRAHQERVGRSLPRRHPGRERFGLAVTRMGMRIAGRDSRTAVDGQRWNGAWSTCAAPPRV